MQVFTRQRTLLLCLLTWVLGFLLCLPSLVFAGEDFTGYDPVFRICAFRRAAAGGYSTWYTFVMLVMPSVIVGFSNAAIFRHWRRSRSRLSQWRLGPPLPSVAGPSALAAPAGASRGAPSCQWDEGGQVGAGLRQGDEGGARAAPCRQHQGITSLLAGHRAEEEEKEEEEEEKEEEEEEGACDGGPAATLHSPAGSGVDSDHEKVRRSGEAEDEEEEEEGRSASGRSTDERTERPNQNTHGVTNEGVLRPRVVRTSSPCARATLLPVKTHSTRLLTQETSLTSAEAHRVQNSPRRTPRPSGAASPCVSVASLDNGFTPVGSAETAPERRSRKQSPRRHLSPSDIALVRSLLTVFVCCVLLYLPLAVATIANMYRPLPAGLGVWSIACAFLNHSVNWVVYGLMNKAFRQGYVRQLVYCCQKRGVRL